MAYRGRFDENQDLVRFAEKVEKVCVDVVEHGKMTKDLAACIHGNNPPKDSYLSTDSFLDCIAAELKNRA